MSYPIVVNLTRRRCVVVGAGKVAERRVDALLRQDAIVRLVAPQATPILRRLAQTGKLTWMQAPYMSEHLEDAFLVFAATDNPEINAAVTRDAHERNLLVCRADDPASGNFITPSVIERGDLVISLTTGGKSPTLTSVLRTRLEQEFGAEWSVWTELFGRMRSDIQNIGAESARKAAVRGVLDDGAVQGRVADADVEGAVKEAKRCISLPPA